MAAILLPLPYPMLRSLIILAVFVPGFYWSLRSRYAAVLMYLWFALFRPQDWLWIDITSLRLSLVLGMVLLVPALLSGIGPNLSHPLSIGMLTFLVSSVLSQWTAVQPALGWQWIDFIARLFVCCMLMVTIVNDGKKLTGVILVIGGSLGFHAGKAGLAFALGGGRFADGLAGAFVDNNGYALGTVMIMPLLIAAAQNMALLELPRPDLVKWVRRAFFLAVPFCGLAVIGTYSRGGFLSLCAAGLVFMLCQKRRVMPLIVITTLFAVGVAFVPQAYIDRLSTITKAKEINEESAMSRPHFWQVGIDMGMSRPFGVGLRQYEQAYDRYDFLHGRYGKKRAVHSSHVQVFAELGFLGALTWTAMFAFAFYACYRVRRISTDERLSPEHQRLLFTMANALMASMAGFVVGGAFLALALNDLTWLTFAAVAALDRIATGMLAAAPVPAPASRRVRVPLAFQVLDSIAEGRGV